MNLPRTTPTNSPSTSSSRDQVSMRAALQSCLEYLDRIDCAHREIRTRFTELLANCQSEVTMEDSGARGGAADIRAEVWPWAITPEQLKFYRHRSDLEREYRPLRSVRVAGTLSEGVDPLVGQLPQPVRRDQQRSVTELLARDQEEIAMGTRDSPTDLQAIVDDGPQTITPESLEFREWLSVPEYGPLGSVGATNALPDGGDSLVGQLPQDPLLCDTSSSVRYQSGAQPSLPQYGAYPEAQTLPDPPVRRDQQPLPHIVQGSHNKVRCTQLRCTKVVRKDGLTRHINEVHRRKVKAVCAGCGKAFTRPYMKKDHIC
ncbi:uncharacterized protein EDB91DRAFT_1349992 [Suillus paluster]|uniref:uncharacterized protein n=1 Tax=Suillus paluster TaxID=48578 RepID=UPI001B85E46E|nr:uncharacterized protein EDB91DRAFT_1349992 [Suillus paluster]KAG1728714.1 hypothetical protein EDB91DRAFT_1349992 [Suillus paluster]